MGQVLLMIFAPIILIVGSVLKAIYWLLFSWWVDPLVGHRLNRRFAQEVRADLSFLFSHHGARFVRGPVERGTMDAAWATVEAENLRLHLLRGLGDLTVTVAPKHAPSDWHDLSLVAMVIETPQGIRPRARCSVLSDVAGLLRSRWDNINGALSAEQYPTIRQRLEGIYDLPSDDLWRAGTNITRQTPTGSRGPLPPPMKR